MEALRHKLFGHVWNPYAALTAAAVLSAAYFAITGTVWAVTGEFTRFGGEALSVMGVDVSHWQYFEMIGLDGSPLTRTAGWIIIGMLLGSLFSILMGESFKWRFPRLKRRLAQGFGGGVIAGFGARMALGCNLAALFTGVPQFSLHAWVFTFTTAAGAYVGVRIIRAGWWRGPLPTVRMTDSDPSRTKTRARGRVSQPVVGVVIGAALLVVVLGYLVTGQSMLAAAAAFGGAFGLLVHRGQICFTAAFRDLWISGRATMSKAIAASMAVGSVLTFVVIGTGTPSLIHVVAPSTVIGGSLFGLGIVLAGGCETGMMYRAMEGQVHFWFVFLGNIVGASVLAYGWDHLGVFEALTAGWPSVNLIVAWGHAGALIGTLLFLGVWFLGARWFEQNYRYGGGARRPAAEVKEVGQVG